uniref:Achain crystal structure of engineered northeast structural genomics consortium target n=1 Tax=Tetraselmis sp. GSL018 TaxID=582737 RepID=A0A061RYW1_9CHLO|mmetsp:Transcript_29559/g.70413  ORF Transcript_29559/g.70413 Transcript_29559/m.70413 type:complete len:205 (-) Transcript_29559:93-707(-)
MALSLVRADEIFLSAVIQGKIERVRDMLDRGNAQVNASCQYLATPLHWAASYDHADVCALLIERGARVNATAVDGSTPLHFAARESCPTAAATLLRHGAQPEARNSSGQTPAELLYDLEDDEDDKAIAKLLASAAQPRAEAAETAGDRSAAAARLPPRCPAPRPQAAPARSCTAIGTDTEPSHTEGTSTGAVVASVSRGMSTPA